jgi:Na+-driven multidrug efflux pump
LPLVTLAVLLLVTLAAAKAAESQAGANGLSLRGRSIRLAMLGLPAIALVMLTGWGPAGVIAGMTATALAAILIALIPWLDRLMLEANCSPRVG